MAYHYFDVICLLFGGKIVLLVHSDPNPCPLFRDCFSIRHVLDSNSATKAVRYLEGPLWEAPLHRH